MVLNVKAGRSGPLISGYTLCFCPAQLCHTKLNSVLICQWAPWL